MEFREHVARVHARKKHAGHGPGQKDENKSRRQFPF